MHLNADFDLSLRAGPIGPDHPFRSQVEAMAIHFLPLAGAGDVLLVHQLPGEGFRRHWLDAGLPWPRLRALPDIDPEAAYRPFGWDAGSGALNRRHARPSPHPPLEVVKQVNGRAFGLEVEAALWPGARAHRLCLRVADIESAMRAEPGVAGWVLKGEHGYSGVANRRIAADADPEGERAAWREFLELHGRAVLEPWYREREDWGYGFEVDRSGGAVGFRLHRSINSARGAFLGLRPAAPGAHPPVEAPLRRAAAEVAAALYHAGYWGPVSVDAFRHRPRPGAPPELRPVVDINARMSLAWPGHALAERLGRDRACSWRLYHPRRYAWPADLAAFRARLGADAFDPGARLGALATSPPPGPSRAAPGRLGMFFCGRDEDHVQAMEARFEALFARAARAGGAAG